MVNRISDRMVKAFERFNADLESQDVDWVVRHINEHLTLEWDFVIDSPFDSMMKQFDTKMLPEFDPWEMRRYDMVQRQVIDKGICIQLAVECADKIISSLMPKEEID